MKRRKNKRQRLLTLDIPTKANRVLHIILIAFFLIGLRLWHLAVIQHEKKLEESRRPQRRVVLEPAKRATIRDRYNIALALNKVQYNATLLYSQMRHIPTIAWETTQDGRRVKRFKRKEYITKLSSILGSTLNLEADRIEDLIHAKGALYTHAPFILKEDLSEQEYYRLKILEKDWPGLQVQCLPKRHYPLDKVAGDIIGHMGAINRQEYENIIHELAFLKKLVQDHEEGEALEFSNVSLTIREAKKRLNDLQEHAYTLHDYVGKTGIEGQFEQNLRGFHGQKSYYSDARGNFLRELPGAREPLAGDRVLLSISSELQEYAEKLLIQNERIRQPRLTTKDKVRFVNMPEKQPWIKGGAIVAMDPHTGDVLAMASYPRYDPNDFIGTGNPAKASIKTANIKRWYESEGYISDIWDQKRPLERERFDELLKIYFEEKVSLNWQTYLSFILPKGNPVRAHFDKYTLLKDAINVQVSFEQLLELSGQTDAYALVNVLYKDNTHILHHAKATEPIKDGIAANLDLYPQEVKRIKEQLDAYLLPLEHNYDKILYIDLCRVIVNGQQFPKELLKTTTNQTLSQYRDASASSVSVFLAAKKIGKELFHEISFKQWRQGNEKSFLREIRNQEKIEKKYARPYIDYLDKKEEDLFNAFWEDKGLQLISELLNPQKTTLKDPFFEHFHALGKELQEGAHAALEWNNHYLTLQASIQSIPNDSIIPYLATLRGYNEMKRPLFGSYRGVKKEKGIHLEKHLAAAFYPINGFSYARSQAYRQAATQGSIFKLVTAYEALAQIYSSKQNVNNLLEINEGFYRQGKDTYIGVNSEGKPIPRFYKGGMLPRSLNRNLGKVDILKALEHSSNPYFAMLAGDVLKSPNDLANAARLFSYGSRTGIDLPAELAGSVPTDLLTNRTGLYSTAIGQHSLIVTPLQTAVMLAAIANEGKVLKPKIVSCMAGRSPNRSDDAIYTPPQFPYQDSLALAGIDFPLFTATVRNQQTNRYKKFNTSVQRQLFMPDAITKVLKEGMRRVVAKDHSDAFLSLSRIYQEYPEALNVYRESKDTLLGKTSTSEYIETMHLDIDDGSPLVNHIWFGGIGYNEKKQPDIVVVVYLKYGGYGKTAAPLAAQIVKKWREIKKQHASPLSLKK